LDHLAWRRKISDHRLEQVSVNARVAIVQKREKLQQPKFDEIEILNYGPTAVQVNINLTSTVSCYSAKR
jgi:hypothetical protein